VIGILEFKTFLAGTGYPMGKITHVGTGMGKIFESAFIPFVSFGDLDNNTFKGLTSLLSVEQEYHYDEHT
jgi:hypothetical protein